MRKPKEKRLRRRCHILYFTLHLTDVHRPSHNYFCFYAQMDTQVVTNQIQDIDCQESQVGPTHWRCMGDVMERRDVPCYGKFNYSTDIIFVYNCTPPMVHDVMIAFG